MNDKEKNFLKAFGEKVRSLRKENNLSQEEFAHRVGLDRSYMGGIERGERNLTLLNIKKISDAFNIDLSELFSGVHHHQV